MTKETSVVVLAGLLAVVLIRGGWRNWIGLVVFTFVLENVAGGWYAFHWHAIKATFNALGGQTWLAPNSVQTPPRLSVRNFTWYWWNLVNQQVLAVFASAFLVGAGVALWRLMRRRVTADNVEPELLGGVIVSYVVMTYLTHKDPRYTLPMLVYVAVLATGWIATLRRPRVRTSLSAAVVVLSIVYFVGMSVGIGGAVRVALPGAQDTIIYSGQLTAYETSGWVRGGPIHDGDVNSLLTGLSRSGIRGVVFETGNDPIDFNRLGLRMAAISRGLGYNNNPPFPANEQAYMILLAPGAAGPRPCQTMNDGSRIYVVREPAPGLDPYSLHNPRNPRQRYQIICPGRASVAYP
jgi:hypothetical protein